MGSNRNFRPVVEALDDRALPSITLVGGVLKVVGTGAADGITVWRPAADGVQVDISNTHESRQFAIADVTKIEIRGGASGDLIILGDGVTLPSEIFGGRGPDTIRGGGAADIVHGGRGHDTIQGRAGNDILEGNEGRDIIRGGAGDDRIDGGNGLDALRGDLGTDTLLSGFDFDNQLIATFASSQGSSQLNFVTGDPAKRTFVTEVKGLAANVTVGVFIDDRAVGTITTNSAGTGTLTHAYDFDSNGDDLPDFPAGCPELHVGSVVQVRLADGTVVRTATFAVKPA
jgi:Ca2+-binding RTX toxin-like protein